jgi:hypothetical protein
VNVARVFDLLSCSRPLPGERERLLVDGAAYARDRWHRRAPTRLFERGVLAAGYGSDVQQGAAYDPSTGRWRALPPAPIRGRDRHAAMSIPDGLLGWGGSCHRSGYLRDGAIYLRDPGPNRPSVRLPATVHRLVNDPFKALSHPIRRGIVERLAAGPATVGVATAGFGVSKPAITKHLRVLEETGVVRREALWGRLFDVVDDYLKENEPR